MKYNNFSILYKQARKQCNVIFPCHNLTWKKCLTIIGDTIVLWYNDSFGSTHVKRLLKV